MAKKVKENVAEVEVVTPDTENDSKAKKQDKANNNKKANKKAR